MLSASSKDTRQGQAPSCVLGALQTCVLTCPGSRLQQLQTSPIFVYGLSVYHPSILRAVCVCVCVCVWVHAHVSVHIHICLCVCVYMPFFVKFPTLSPWFCPERQLALAFSEVAILQTLVGHLQKNIVSGPFWLFLMRAQGKYEEVRCLQGMHIVNFRP